MTTTAEDIQALVGDLPDVMEFESWWNERANTQNRYMLILFFPAVNQFQIMCDDSKVPLVITISDRTGAPLRAWDLYVGAPIDVFGRTTTLMAASMKTIQWLDAAARRLWKVKEALEMRLNKFRQKALVALNYGSFKLLTTHKNRACLGGVLNVGKIAATVLSLERELAQFQ